MIFAFFFVIILVIVILAVVSKTANSQPDEPRSKVEISTFTPLSTTETPLHSACYCVVDVETSGLPKWGYNARASDTSTNPYVLSIAWIILDFNCDVIRREYHILKQSPDIEYSPAAIAKNGITPEVIADKGEDIKKVLSAFENQTRCVSFFVGHNIDFDKMMIQCECLRHCAIDPFDRKSTFCTMKSTTAIFVGGKWPKLEQLARALFGSAVNDYNFHDAMADAEMTACCFKELIARNYVKAVPVPENGKVDTSMMLPDEELVSTTTKFYHTKVAILGTFGGIKKQELAEAVHKLGATVGSAGYYTQIVLVADKLTEKQTEKLDDYKKSYLILHEDDVRTILTDAGIELPAVATTKTA